MDDGTDDALAARLCSLHAASVVAAAGCGKTEQIVRATARGDGRRLILTHTHAGADSLRKRFREHDVSSALFSIDTIAGWCLRYPSSFPIRSGLSITITETDRNWDDVYSAAARLISSGAVNRVLRASYCGVFVDEYQDCGLLQHKVITTLSSLLPVSVFGDPLQAIFDFNGQQPVDWHSQVFPCFPQALSLSTPHRWHKHGNIEMAGWLEDIRSALEAGKPLDFRETPDCVSWVWLPDQAGPRQQKIVSSCLSAMGKVGDLVVIGDPINLASRTLIARKLAKQGFSNIEPLSCKDLYIFAEKLGVHSGLKRFDATMNFLQACISGIELSEFNKAVAARNMGGRRGEAKFGLLVDMGLALQRGAGDAVCLELIQGFSARPTSYVFRREMLSSALSALKIVIARDEPTLTDSVWYVQNRIRHTGRHIAHRSIGSTLLVKGLEFAHSVVVHSPNMNKKDWYVALTRATHTLTVLAPKRVFIPEA
jgi:hypothetical protein